MRLKHLENVLANCETGRGLEYLLIYLRGEAAGLGEHVEVSAGEGEGDGLLHLDGDGLLLLVHVGGLGQLDVAHADVAGSGELDALLGARDHHRLAELGEILQ